MKIMHNENTAATECKFCRDPIHPNARICKACGEPQDLFRRGGRLISGMLSLLVALGSLAIAFLQYSEAQAARGAAQEARVDASEARGDAQEARVEAVAAQAALNTIVNSLEDDPRAKLRDRLSPTLRDQGTLERERKERPTDERVRRDLLLQDALNPGARTRP